MKKLAMLGIIGGAAILTAAPLSLQWPQKNVVLSLDSAKAQEGRPLTHRKAHRRAAYGTAVAGGYGYYRYNSPAYSGYSAPSYYGNYRRPFFGFSPAGLPY